MIWQKKSFYSKVLYLILIEIFWWNFSYLIFYYQNNATKYADKTGKVVRKWEQKSAQADLTDKDGVGARKWDPKPAQANLEIAKKTLPVINLVFSNSITCCVLFVL